MNREDQEFERTLDLLREGHREPIAEAHYAAVRARVLSQLAVERRPWRRMWGYGFGVVAAAMLLTIFWLRHTPVGQALPPADRALEQARRAQAPLLDSPAQSERAGGRRKLLPHRRVAMPAAYRVVGPPAPQPLVVKLVTNDPNVVIYWISGE
jgi:hypothetical protein